MMGNDNQMTKKYSLETFLKDHVIVIPAMQRDYAQGRDNAEATNIRKLFVSSILDAVFNSNNLTLDFTYGDSLSNDEIRYYPVDGQQRLTTLFLVYAYVLVKARQEEDYKTVDRLKVLKNFHFEERFKAEEYIRTLLSCNDDTAELTMPELWHESPTAEGLARTYSLISSEFKGSPEKNSSLRAQDYLTRLEKITFMEIHSNLPNDVFCKMNARGRTLTDFEVFKTGVVKKFKKEECNGFAEVANKFYEKLFKKYGNNQDIDIDKCVTKKIMWIIRNWFAFLECPNDKKKFISNNLDDYIAFDDYFGNTNFIETKKNIEAVDNIYAIRTLSSFFIFFSKAEKDPEELIDYTLPDRKKGKIEINNNINSDILSACIAFFGREREWTEYDNLKDWMRFVCNILDNTDNSLERTKLFVSIGMACDIKKEIERYQIENAPVLKTQLEEEQRKLNLIENNKSWAEPIIEAENHEILNGRISVLLNITDATEKPEKFKTYYNCLKNLWDSCMTDGSINGTKFALKLLPYYEEKLPKKGIRIPVKFSKPDNAKDILYNSMPDTFCKYAYDIVYWKCRKNATDDSPYWIRALCGEYGEKLIMSTCSDDNQRFVSAYWDRLPVLWAKSTCTWRSFNNVILSERNEYISKLLMTGKFKLTCLNHNGISKLPYFKEWEILLLFEERYHFRTEDWLPDKIFLLDKEDKEIISKEGTHYCVDIKDAQSVVEETRTVIAKAQDEGSSF